MKPWRCNVREVAQLHRFRFSMETVTDDLPVKLDARDVFFSTHDRVEALMLPLLCKTLTGFATLTTLLNLPHTSEV